MKSQSVPFASASLPSALWLTANISVATLGHKASLDVPDVHLLPSSGKLPLEGNAPPEAHALELSISLSTLILVAV